jgi:hypothetical protein
MTNYSNDKAGIPGKMKRYFFSARILLSAAVISVLAFLSSCEEKSTVIGMDLLPGSDFVNISGTDTITPLAYTNYTDSVMTSSKAYSYLGGLFDTRFGYASADFVGQMRLTKPWPKTGLVSVDSVKLFFEMTGAKGVYNTDIYMKIYEISELLFPDSLYYSDRDPSIDHLLASFKLPLVKKDSLVNYVIKLADEFTPELGAYLLRDTTKLYQDVDSIKKDFRSYFKGVYITVTDSPTKNNLKGGPTGVPLLMAYTFSSDNFIIRIYYHDKKRAAQVLDLKINDKSARYNRYFHDFSQADPIIGIKHINDSYRDTVTYLQGLNGAFTRIKLSGLEQYKSMGNIAVNRARLTVPVFLNETYTTTTVPSKIYLSYVSSKGVKTIVPDYYVSSTFFDGTLNSTNKKYTFNLAAFVQEYLEGRIPNPELEMYFADGEYRNVILKTSLSSNPAKFELVYTKK